MNAKTYIDRETSGKGSIVGLIEEFTDGPSIFAQIDRSVGENVDCRLVNRRMMETVIRP